MKMPASSDIFLFADFRLDRTGGGLFRRDRHGAFTPVTIGSRALDLLAALIERRGDVVSKEEVMAAVWPKTTVEEALAIDPNFAMARGFLGLAQRYIGRAEETEAHVLEALRLSPRDRLRYHWLFYAGAAKANLGEWAQAQPWLRKSIDANRNYPLPFFYLAACLARLARLDEAHSEVKAGLAGNPRFTLRRYRAGAESDNAVYLTQRERIIEGMRMAGVPEG
jgi:tetratricopeptide (TPR) repeat protein